MNQAILEGEIRKTPQEYGEGERRMARFTMCTIRDEETKGWHFVVVRDPHIDAVLDLQVGAHVHVEGELQSRSYNARGQRQRVVEVVVVPTRQDNGP